MKFLNKKIYIYGVIVLMLAIVIYYVFFNKIGVPNGYIKNPLISGNMIEVDTAKKLQEQEKLVIPPEYSMCKKNLQMLDCIIKVDTNNQKLLNTSSITNSIDKMNEFEKQLGPNQAEIIANIAYNIQDIYSTRKPGMIFEDFSCKTNFCEKIIGDAKIQIVQRMFNRGLIKKDSTCNKIPENLPKEYCLSLFKK